MSLLTANHSRQIILCKTMRFWTQLNQSRVKLSFTQSEYRMSVFELQCNTSLSILIRHNLLFFCFRARRATKGYYFGLSGFCCNFWCSRIENKKRRLWNFNPGYCLYKNKSVFPWSSPRVKLEILSQNFDQTSYQ